MGGARMVLRALAVAGLVCGIALADLAHAQEGDEAAALNAEAVRLYQAGKHLEAEPLLKRSLALREKALGPQHHDVGLSLNNLAVLYRAQGRYAEAEPLFKRSLAIFEKELGPGDPVVATAVNGLAGMYHEWGRYPEAEALYQRSLAIFEKALGPEHPSVAPQINNLGLLYQAQERYAEAEAFHKRALAIQEAAKGPNHADLGPGLANLGTLYYRQGRYADAEQAMKRALALYEAALGAEHPDLGQHLNNLAELYRAQASYAEAEPLYKRTIGILERAFGPNHPNLGASLSNLAELYRAQGRYADAELVARRALTIRETAFGAEHRLTSSALITLATVLGARGRYTDAEPLLRRSLSILEKALGPDHSDVGGVLNLLALLYSAQDRHADAEPLTQRALAIYEKTLGADHLHTATVLNNLAELHRARGRYEQAEPAYKRALSIYEKALGADHPGVASILNNLAAVHLGQQDWGKAVPYLRRSTSMVVARSRRGVDAIGRAASGKAVNEVARDSLAFSLLITAAHRLVAAGRADTFTLAGEMFRTAQWGLGTEASTALAQMAARQARGDGALARLVRERQDLVGEWQAKDELLITARTEPPARRKAETEAALGRRLAAIDTRMAEIDRTLAKDFPEYTALAAPESLDVGEVQAYLRPDEALVLFLVTPEWKSIPEESFIWVVTRTAARWVRSDLGSTGLAREVSALRCGLDEYAWEGAGAERCSKALGMAAANAKPLPFDRARAHKLYIGLFGAVEDLIKGKHLLIVPSGALTQLPFQVLVSEGVGGGGPGATAPGNRAVAWLTRSHAISILPAVASLKALRRVARPSAGSRPMIGFGNPLLDGPDRRYAVRARLARTKQRCPETRGRRSAAVAGLRGGVARVETLGGLADLAHIKRQVPLPETADELCAVAHDVRAAAGDIRLGPHATEREVKRLSASGELARYRMLHFATHGALAGELKGTREPGLILTPPESASAEDDGYLSASEIAGLRLDADWVILSACNTAAGGADNAEALAGLARAFIYAQARALLVSHWAVDSDATVKLVTATIGQMARDAGVGRAEAMRRSMLALIDKGEPHEAHPALWAPFVVVGEGAPAP